MLQFEGLLLNEYGDKLGCFFYDTVTMTYAIKIYGKTVYGYTLKGVYQYADKIYCQVW